MFLMPTNTNCGAVFHKSHPQVKLYFSPFSHQILLSKLVQTCISGFPLNFEHCHLMLLIQSIGYKGPILSWIPNRSFKKVNSVNMTNIHTDIWTCEQIWTFQCI